ncbi:MAG: tRNA pseudouridine(38-40) synthase TruA [Anaerolineae bacterium]|nr:tRNA pseudouridine(38-40) synthase TruA [Anaerolineae bacterium]
MRGYRAVVEYDGTDYHGFQIQVGVPTIQEELERALARITGEEVRIVGAGRTDTGVHATGQVIAFQVIWRHPLAELQQALNAVLPAAIVVKELAGAPDGFHPRFSASSRVYRYTVLNQPWRSPIWARFAHHVAAPLAVEAMNEAAATMAGRHDFAAFGQPPQGENTVRNVLRAEWRRDNFWCSFYIEADAFLRGMVRSLVGTMLLVGHGRLSVSEFADILASGNRGRAAPPALPCGLCLIEVKYER